VGSGEERARYKNRKFDEEPYEIKKFGWPAVDEESPDDRAPRLHLERRGTKDVTHELQAPERTRLTEVRGNPCESLITSRPWYLYGLESEEKKIRYGRLPRAEWKIYGLDLEASVKEEWKQKNDWKDGGADKPGWKWRHESPSPEPGDLIDIEFRPSETDALDSVPPPPPTLSAPDHRRFANIPPFSEGLSVFRHLQQQNVRARSIQESQSGDSREHKGPEAPPTGPIDGGDGDPSALVLTGPLAASAAEHGESSILARSHQSDALYDHHGNRHGLQPLPPARLEGSPSSRPTRPAMPRERFVAASITREKAGDDKHITRSDKSFQDL
jgi:hypothetical protein